MKISNVLLLFFGMELLAGCSVRATLREMIGTQLSAFQIVPPSAEITDGGVLQLSGENGKAPYKFEKVSGSGTVSEDGSFTAGGGGTTVTVMATDQENKTAYAVFSVVKAPEILPQTQTLAVLNKFHFSATGGKSPYTFQIKTGGGSITSGGEFTAPGTSGVSIIEVVDALGGKGQATITIVDALALSPATAVMSANTFQVFSTSGGVAPIRVEIESGGGSLDAGTLQYSAPGVAGVATLKATDSLGNEARAQITINGPLLISPLTLELVVNSSYTFAATGGVSPYTYSLLSGSGSVTAAGTYTAPGAIGTAQVRVMDALGATSVATVNVNLELSFIFPNISMLVGESKNLSLNVIGGIPPLTFSVSPGAGTVDPVTGYFTAGTSPGVYTATVVDSKGYRAQAAITLQSPVSIDPQMPTLMVGTQLSFSASGGFGPYTYSVVTGGGSFSGALLTAPGTPQSLTVKATDSMGNFATTTVTVTSLLEISPSTASLIVGATQSFSASGGVGSYSFALASGSGSIDSQSGLYTASPQTGTAVVEVLDSHGNSAQAQITILEEVQIIPDLMSMAKNSALTVLATGGQGPFTFSIVSGDGSIDATSGVFTSSSVAGTVVVKATDSLGNSDTGTITIQESLLISPLLSAIVVNETLTLTASGGQSPYVFSVVEGASSGNVDASTGVLTATATVGTVKVRVTDALNQTSDATVDVRASLSVSPVAVTLAAGNTEQFVVSGGVSPYSFAVQSGGGSVSGSGLYTAPGNSGTAVIRVTDSGGRTVDATVTVNDALSLSPTLAYVKYSDLQNMVATGGVAPLVFSKVSGPGSVNSSSGVFTADTSPGTSVLRVTDALGNFAEATVETVEPVEISPASKDLAFAEVFGFLAIKGLAPYAFTVTAGGGTIDGTSGAYTAPSAVGTATILVTDALGQTATASVNIYEALTISPSLAFIATTQSQNLSASGGVPPYAFSLMSGNGSVQSSPDRYVAGASANTAKVKVTDNLGNITIGTINVVGPVQISPASFTMAVNETKTFTASGGGTPYAYSVAGGGGGIDASSGLYTAPAVGGTATVRVTDTLNQTSEAIVTIVNTLSLSPATVTLAVNNQQQFTPGGGVGPYTYVIDSGAGSVNASGLYTAGASAGSAVVKVTDSEGRTATASVTVNGALAISPTSKELIYAGTETFTATGGVAPYSYTVVVPGAGSVGVTTGAYVAPNAAGTETVRVTDSLGNTSDATLTVYSPVQISPTTKTLIVGASDTFSASGGKSPYAYAVSVGGGTITNVGAYTAGSTPGSYTVRVTDSLSQISDAVVTVEPVIDLSPNSSTIRVGETKVLTLTNGASPFNYSVTGGGSFSSGTMTYTAPTTPTTATVQVTDNNSATDSVTITVTAGLPGGLSFVTSAQTVIAGTCSGVTTLELQDSYGNDTVATATTTVNLAASNLTFYSDSSCTSAVTSRDIALGSGSVDFYFKGTQAGFQMITATSTGLAMTTQSNLLTAGSADKLAFSPSSLTSSAGACSAVSNLRVTDTYGNPLTPSGSYSVSVSGSGISLFSDSSCSSSLASPMTLSNSQATQDIYFKGTAAGTVTMTGSATGLTSGTLSLTVNPGAAYKLAFDTQPAITGTKNNALNTQPKVGIYDQYDNFVNSATDSVTLTAATNSDCSSTNSSLSATANPKAAVSGFALFAGVKFDASGTFYIKASSGSLQVACSSSVAITADYSQTFASIPGNIPHDGLAVATALIIPKEGSINVGPGKVVEVTSSSSNVTVTCNGGACGACETPSATCYKTYDHGQGAYSFEVKSSTQGSANFDVKYKDAGSFNIISTLSTNFDTSNFTTAASITNANAGQNLYLTSGTVTFNANTVGLTFGHVFVRGATLVHASTTTGTTYKLDVTFGSLTIQSGGVDVTGTGYPVGYSYGATTPATGLAPGNTCGGSHGGKGASWVGSPCYAQTYGDYRDPQYPGGGGPSGQAGIGGGVVRITTTGVCNVGSAGSIRANGSTAGAGGSIKLTCGGYVGAIGAGSLQANGGSSIQANYPSGGGGRIALISTGNEANFAGNFAWPSDSTKMTNFVSRIQSRGGYSTSTSLVGGAGTIYIKHSGLTYGGLIIGNGGNADAYTVSELPSIAKTTGTVSGSTLPFTTSLPSTAYNDLYKGMRLRPDVTATNGTANDLLDDNIVTITANAQSNVTVSGSLAGVPSGVAMRTLEVLDYLYVTGASTLTTGSDVVVLSGNFQGANLDFTDGLLNLSGSNVIIPTVNTVTLTAGNYTGTSYSGTNLVVSGATVNFATVSVNNLTVSSGNYGTTTSTTVSNDLSISGGTSTSPTVNITRDLLISGGTAVFNTINVNRNYSMTAGTLKHSTTTTTTAYKMEMSVAGDFSLTGGSIDVSSIGYTVGYSYGATAPLTGLSPGTTCGGSHGGKGASWSGSPCYAQTYGDYRDPQYPGGGGPSSYAGTGGGVVRITTTGMCTVGSAGSIRANGSTAGAGGSIKLTCGGFAGTIGTAGLQANGGSSIQANYPSGGGGRIALISTGNEANFAGNFAWPSDSTKMTNFVSRIQSRGGYSTSTSLVGGAGTIYIKHSGLTYGGLIIGNGGNADAYTVSELPSIAKTTGTVSGSTLPFTTSLPSTAYNDLYKGMRLRPDVTATNGTANDLLDDNIVTITANAQSNVTVSGSLAGVPSGVAMRTLEVLDYLYVTGASTLTTGSDVVVLSGNFQGANLDFTDGLLNLSGSNVIIPTVNTVTLTAGNYTGTSYSGTNLVVSGATVNFATVSVNNLTVSSGNYGTTTSTTVSNDLSISGGTSTSPTVNITRDLLISGGTAVFNAINVNRNYSMTAGTLKHSTTTTTTAYKMEMSVAGDFSLTGGSIDVSSIGYTVGYSYGATAPSTGLAPGNTCGGSHGGKGASWSGSPCYAQTYGDYRDPQYPGGGGPSGQAGTGGGVVRITTTGVCTVGSAGSIKSNGSTAGAGGSIKLICGSFAGTIGAGGLQANGGSSSQANYPSGGGGRIALISTGNEASFGDNFTWPNDSTKMTNFVSRVQSRGGFSSATSMVGGAGTIYIKHSGLTYGGLIIGNGGNADAYTVSELPSIAKTTGTVSGSTLPFTTSLPSTAYNDLYKGMRLRPDVTATNGTANDLLDDNIVTITANAQSNVTVSGSLAGVPSGVAMRTLEVLDYLYVTGASTLTTGSDVVVLSGNFLAPTLDFTNGFINLSSSNLIYPAVDSVTLSSGSYYGTNYNGKALTINGGTFSYTGTLTLDSLTIVTSSTIGTVNTTGDLTISSGTNTITTANAGRDLIINGGTNTITTASAVRDFNVTSGTNTIPTVSAGQNMTVSGGTNTMQNFSVTQNFAMTAGSLAHPLTTTTVMYKVNMTVGNNFSVTGGSIDVSSRGYTATYSYGPTAPATALGATSGCGGGHGGRGYGTCAANPGITFDDYRDPQYAGGAGTSGSGGGVVRINATGVCTVGSAGSIKANGGTAGAGGSIKMTCGGFAGTIAAGGLQANGGSSSTASSPSGGGGRIALISTGNEASFADNFIWPTDSTKMTNLVSRLQARGGAATATTYVGGAGTIYIKHSGLTYGGLIVSNGGNTSANEGKTQMLSSTANTNLINAKVDATNLKVTAASTPFTGMVDLFKGAIVHVWPAGGELDPMSGTHTVFTVTSNTTNNFVSTAAPFNSLTISNDHPYRFTHTLDMLYVGEAAKLDMASSDLIIVGGGGYACDFVSAGSNFAVPAGSSILNGNSYSSVNCPDGNFSTKGTTINFTRYCNGLGTCL